MELDGAPGVGVPMMIIADSAYSPMQFVLPAFTDAEIAVDPQGRTLFNKKHALTRNAIERAFGVLKQRWRVLLMTTEVDVETLVYIIAACCILHNICILHDCPAPPADAELQFVGKVCRKVPQQWGFEHGASSRYGC